LLLAASLDLLRQLGNSSNLSPLQLVSVFSARIAEALWIRAAAITNASAAAAITLNANAPFVYITSRKEVRLQPHTGIRTYSILTKH
jgi:hypothetical protein